MCCCLQGVMLYVENVYSKSANCLGEGTEGSDDDDGLIRFCMDNASGESTRNTGDKSGRFERMQKRIEKEAAKWGRKINASKKPAKPGKSVDAKVAYVDPDAPPAEYYKLDFAYIMKGTITYYDDTGAVKWLGHVQIVEDLQFHYATPGDPATAVKVKASELPATATIVDCSEVELKWLNAHNSY